MLLAAVLSAASLPPVDDPDTPVDESDLQIYLALPAPLNITFVRPVAASANLPKPSSCAGDTKARASSREFIQVSKQSRPHSLQKLLCTFLI